MNINSSHDLSEALNISKSDAQLKNSSMRERDCDGLIRAALEALEEDIAFGYLHPRERLVEDDLRTLFGLKRHVVRQVLAELEQMGLIERKKNIGACVKSYTIQEVVDLYIIREILEVGCVSHIPFPVSEANILELEDLQKKHDEAVANSNLRAAFRTNIAFHKAVFNLSGNKMLTDLIEQSAQAAYTIRSLSMVNPDMLETSRRDHWKIIDALRQADRDKLTEVCRLHIVPSRDIYIEQQLRRASKSSENKQIVDSVKN